MAPQMLKSIWQPQPLQSRCAQPEHTSYLYLSLKTFQLSLRSGCSCQCIGRGQLQMTTFPCPRSVVVTSIVNVPIPCVLHPVFSAVRVAQLFSVSRPKLTIEGYCFGDMFEELLGVFERKSPSKARLLDGIEGRPSLRKRVTSTSLSSELSRNMSDPT